MEDVDNGPPRTGCRSADPDNVPAAQGRPSGSRNNRRVQIAAAKARVTLDKRLDEETPQWIVDLANEKAE